MIKIRNKIFARKKRQPKNVIVNAYTIYLQTELIRILKNQNKKNTMQITLINM